MVLTPNINQTLNIFFRKRTAYDCDNSLVESYSVKKRLANESLVSYSCKCQICQCGNDLKDGFYA